MGLAENPGGTVGQNFGMSNQRLNKLENEVHQIQSDVAKILELMMSQKNDINLIKSALKISEPQKASYRSPD